VKPACNYKRMLTTHLHDFEISYLKPIHRYIAVISESYNKDEDTWFKPVNDNKFLKFDKILILG
jgi:hypothetical protein